MLAYLIWFICVDMSKKIYWCCLKMLVVLTYLTRVTCDSIF